MKRLQNRILKNFVNKSQPSTTRLSHFLMKINAKGSDIFRNKMAIMMYDNMRDNSDVYESGVDDCGMIYFAYLNGTVKRYKRNEFLKMAKEKDF